METKMQKVRNVNKMLLFATLFLCVCFYGFSQKTLEGVFDNQTGDFCKFYPDGTFEYREYGELGINSYGEGHYLLTKDSLILNFDSTKLHSDGYAILKPYKTFYGNEDVNLKIRVFDKNKQPILEEMDLLILNDSIVSSPKRIFDIKGGEIDLVLKKQDNEVLLYFASDESRLDVKVPLYCNYEVDVYLFDFFFDIGHGRKYVTWKYKLVKMRKDFFEVKTRGGNVLRFERTKENDYVDDPFGKNDPFSKYLDNRID